MKKKLNHNSKARYSKRRRILMWLLPLLICLVVGVTDYALTFPAITMEGEYLCEKEAHAHGVSCYAKDENGELVLVCDKEEHIHDERCLIPEPEPERYICGHAYEHKHEDGCYRDGVLVCTLEEHTHTNGCLAMQYRQEFREFRASLMASDEEGDEPELSSPLLSVDSDAQALTGVAEPEAINGTEEAAEEKNDLLNTEPEAAAAIEQSAANVEVAGEQAAEPDGETAGENADEKQPSDAPGDETGEDLENSRSEEEEKTEEGDSEPTRGSVLRGAEDDDEDEEEPEEPEDLVNAVVAKGGWVRFSVYKEAPGVEEPVFNESVENGHYIDTTLASGGGYVFKLEVYTGEGGLDPGSYFYDIDCCGCTLYWAEGERLTPLEEWASGEGVKVGPNLYLKVTREGNVYRFLFTSKYRIRNPSITGNLGGAGEPAVKVLTKSAQWNPSKLAYTYIIAGTIPRAMDTIDQYFYFKDETSIFREDAPRDAPLTYKGFYQNRDTLTVTLGGQTLRPLSPDNTDDFAYYMETNPNSPNLGNIYLLNRKNHSVSCPVDAGTVNATLAGMLNSSEYSGWCLCWQQLENLPYTITYDDCYGREYVLNNRYVNTVDLVDKEQTLQRTANGENIHDLLDKKYEVDDSKNRVFTLTFNSSDTKGIGDLGSEDGKVLVLKDTMTYVKIKDGTEPKIIRDGQLMNGGYSLDYILDGSGNRIGFTISVPQPGQHSYVVRYEVQSLDPNAPPDEIWNNAEVNFAGDEHNAIRVEKKPKYEGEVTELVGDTYYFTVRLKKVYEGGNPPVGGRFGVYDAATDNLIAESYVDPADSRRKVVSGGRVKSRVAYLEGAAVDTITFDAAYLIKDKVYYIKEIEPPDGYQPNDTLYYFYASYARNPVLPSVSYHDPYTADDVTVFDYNAWTVEDGTPIFDKFLNENAPMQNPKYRYDLPETGSSGTLLLRAVGGGLILAAGAMLIARKRESAR